MLRERREQDRTEPDMNSVDMRTRIGRRLFAALALVAVVGWTLLSPSTHTPQVIETLQAHAEMIAEHGHSHGLEEDLAWALHGHSHDVADHDHRQAVRLATGASDDSIETSARWRGFATAHWSPPVFRLERPPRA